MRSTSAAAGRSAGRPGSRPTTGTMWLRLTTVASGGQAADQLDGPGSSATSSCASRSAPCLGRLPGVEAAPGEADLAAVAAQVDASGG